MSTTKVGASVRNNDWKRRPNKTLVEPYIDEAANVGGMVNEVWGNLPAWVSPDIINERGREAAKVEAALGDDDLRVMFDPLQPASDFFGADHDEYLQWSEAAEPDSLGHILVMTYDGWPFQCGIAMGIDLRRGPAAEQAAVELRRLAAKLRQRASYLCMRAASLEK